MRVACSLVMLSRGFSKSSVFKRVRMGILASKLATSVPATVGKGEEPPNDEVRTAALTRQRRSLSYSVDSPQGGHEMSMVSFNLLAPCYKRLATRNNQGRRMRESQDDALWNERAQKTLKFLQDEIVKDASIIGLQEYWLEESYRDLFEPIFEQSGYDMRVLKRKGEKSDSVVLLVKKDEIDILETKEVQLLSNGDRVALILHLRQCSTDTQMILANTHLSFPHTSLDTMIQMRQIVALTESVNNFHEEVTRSLGELNHKRVHRIIMGDFNQSLDSPLCDHLRGAGYVSAFEICPPPLSPSINMNLQSQMSIRDNSDSKPDYRMQRNASSSTLGSSFDATDPSVGDGAGETPPLSPDGSEGSWVSHFTHRREEVGVDHVFFYDPTAEPPPQRASPQGGVTAMPDTEGAVAGNKLLIRASEVLPSDLACATWESGFDISDHRPIGVKLVLI